jgi:hypothetical protein
MDKASPTSVFLTRGASLLKLTLLGAGAGVALATVSFAQSYDPDVGSGNIVGSGVAYMVQPDGSTNRLGGRTGTVNATGHAMAMTHGTEVKPGAVLYRSGGKLYLIHNQMIDGKMVEEHAKGWAQ